jgi:hypothetical protein
MAKVKKQRYKGMSVIDLSSQKQVHGTSVTAIQVITGCLTTAGRIAETETESIRSLFTLELKNAMPHMQNKFQIVLFVKLNYRIKWPLY